MSKKKMNEKVWILTDVLHTLERELGRSKYTWDSYYGSPYICDNIRRSANFTFATSGAANKVISLVSKRLDGCTTLEQWLYRNRHITYDKYNDWKYKKKLFKKMQQTRINWVKSLIEELS